MDWIRLSSVSSSITHNLMILSLSENQRGAETFTRQSFISRDLPFKFKDMHYTYVESLTGRQSDIEFILYLPTQYEHISILMTVSLDEESIKYQSYPIKNYETLLLTNEQAVALGRYCILVLNGLLSKGWMCVDLEIGQIKHKSFNRSLGYLQKRIEKFPRDVIVHIYNQVVEIQKNWVRNLPYIFGLLDVWEKKILNHPYWSQHEDPKGLERSDHFALISDYIKNSFIEEPLMIDERLWARPPLEDQKRIRYVPLSEAEKQNKLLYSKTYKDSLVSTASHLTEDMMNALSPFVSSQKLADEDKRVGTLVDSSQKHFRDLVEISLLVNKNQSPNSQIYSQFAINRIISDKFLAQSNFSTLKILRLTGKFAGKPESNEPVQLVEKTPKGENKFQDRFRNQSQVLRKICQGRCLFVARFFFNQRQEEPRKIYSELCQIKSLDNYISGYRNMLSVETKLSLIFRTALGVKFLRDNGIVHNDLKPQNVLLKYMGNKKRGYFFPRLIDFGESQEIHVRGRHRTLPEFRRGYTVPYAPPEQVNLNQHSQKTDVYSLGVMIIEFIFGYFPLQMVRLSKDSYNSQSNQLYQRLMSFAPERLDSFFLPDGMHLLYQLALRCIQPEKQFRPTIDWFIIIIRTLLQSFENAPVVIHKAP